MSASVLPLGSREDLKHEWKSSAVLMEGKDKVAREVVAMLNAEGGEIWVGLGEENGFAVRVEPIENVEQERIALRDRITDLVEPAPTSDEVVLDVVTVPGEHGAGAILKVAVGRPTDDRRPFSLKTKESRHYLTRFEDRVRSMDYSEVAAAFRRESVDRAQIRRELRERAERERRAAEARYPGRTALWILFQPEPPLSQTLDLTQLRPYLSDPARSENVDVYHWESFVVPGLRVRASGDVLTSEADSRRLEIGRDGVAQYSAILPTAVKREGRPIESELLPDTLIPLVLSSIRLIGSLVRDFSASAGVIDAALFRCNGLALNGGVPFGDPWLWMAESKEKRTTYSGEELSAWFDFSRPELVEAPDRCAFRLIRRIYDAFGLDESGIPWWNPTTGLFDLKR